MKRKGIILGSIYFVILVIGIWINGQKGMNLMSDFWLLKKDGSFTHQDNRIRHAKEYGDDYFEVQFGTDSFTAALEEQEDGWYMETSKGWGIKIPTNTPFSVIVEVGSRAIWMGDAQVTIHDLDAMGLRFEAAKEEEVNYIYDGEGNERVGESHHLVSESGQTISYREIWYDNPEQSTPEQQVVTLGDGITIRSENDQNTLYVNEKGEYLINHDSLFMMPYGYGYMSRSGLAQALVQVAEGEVEQRGHLSLVLVYTLFYAFGTAVFLWPEKMAFLGNRWRFRYEPELSEEGLLMEMIGGVIVIGVAVVTLFLPLVG